MKKIKITALCMLLLGSHLLSSCYHHTEPEQVYPVAAMGFDAAEEGIRVTVEIAVVDDSELSKSKSLCFSQNGESVENALNAMETGLPRALIFSHCALAVLGEALSKERMQEIFAFAGAEEGLPLAAEVVVSQNAEQLLKAKSVSSVAMGYEIPQILEQERRRLGAEMPCSVYELRSVASPELPIALPRFVTVGDGEMPSVRFDGLDILRPNAPSYRLSVEECVSHAILTDTYRGADQEGIRWGRVYWQIQTTKDQNGERMELTVKMEASGGNTADMDVLASRLQSDAEGLYRKVRRTVDEDLFLLDERLKRQDQQWSPDAPLTVGCWIKVRE